MDTRSMEDRLLVVETKLDFLATKAELQEGLSNLRVWMIGLTLSTNALVITLFLVLLARIH